MYCGNCGAERQEGAAFCVSCGVGLRGENRRPLGVAGMVGLAVAVLVPVAAAALLIQPFGDTGKQSGGGRELPGFPATATLDATPVIASPDQEGSAAVAATNVPTAGPTASARPVSTGAQGAQVRPSTAVRTSAPVLPPASSTPVPASAPTTSPVLPPLIGEWTGMVTEKWQNSSTRATTYPVRVSFSGDSDAPEAVVEYPGLGCIGTWEFLESRLGTARFIESISEGNCQQDVHVSITGRRDGGLDYGFVENGLVGEGVLRK